MASAQQVLAILGFNLMSLASIVFLVSILPGRNSTLLKVISLIFSMAVMVIGIILEIPMLERFGFLVSSATIILLYFLPRNKA